LLLLGATFALRAQSSVPAALPGHNQLPPTNDPKEIVRRALDVDQTSFKLARNYTYDERQESKILKGGAVKKDEVSTYEVTILYDEPYSRRIRKNDKPLTGKEEQKESEKLDKFVDQRKNESDDEHQKRLAKMEKEREEERAFVGDVINAYDFRLAGEERVDGIESYRVDAIPRKDFHPTQPHADILTKLQAKLWISKQDYGCVKLEAQTLDTISFGLFLVRIHKGSQIQYEQTRVNDEIWLPRLLAVHAGARVALVSNGVIDFESTYSNYKKFTSDVRILPGAAEVQPAPGSVRKSP
jgi:hypothetical protein